MLVNWHEPDHVYLVCGKTDLRKGIDGLAMVIAEHYGLELKVIKVYPFVKAVVTGEKKLPVIVIRN